MKEPITIWAPDEIWQDARDRLIEMIRVGGIAYLRANPTKTMHEASWRDKPYMDGIAVDLDESDVCEFIADYIIQHADPSTEGAPK